MPSTNIEMLQTVANGLGDLDALTEGIERALPYGSDEEATEIIMKLMQRIVNGK